jgi:hypothetical protein
MTYADLRLSSQELETLISWGSFVHQNNGCGLSDHENDLMGFLQYYLTNLLR